VEFVVESLVGILVKERSRGKLGGVDVGEFLLQLDLGVVLGGLVGIFAVNLNLRPHL
jgi:hypothetical protein